MRLFRALRPHVGEGRPAEAFVDRVQQHIVWVVGILPEHDSLKLSRFHILDARKFGLGVVVGDEGLGRGVIQIRYVFSAFGRIARILPSKFPPVWVSVFFYRGHTVPGIGSSEMMTN